MPNTTTSYVLLQKMLNNILGKKIKILFVAIFSITFLTSCSNIAPDSQNQTQILIEYALYDFPLPEDAEIQMDSTVILGSGDLWAGQIILLSKSSPVELIKYFTESAKSSGWNLASSTISEKVLLVFNKNERIATIEISKYKCKPENIYQDNIVKRSLIKVRKKLIRILSKQTFRIES